jgi:hypothetical protein
MSYEIMLLTAVLAFHLVTFSQQKSYTIVFPNKKADAEKIDHLSPPLSGSTMSI